jgi:hypothetical protein
MPLPNSTVASAYWSTIARDAEDWRPPRLVVKSYDGGYRTYESDDEDLPLDALQLAGPLTTQ